MLSNVFLTITWVALGASALCLICSLYVVLCYPKFAQWYAERNRTAPTRLRGYWRCVGWAFAMLLVSLLFAIAAYKAPPDSHSTRGTVDGSDAVAVPAR
ncbi:hypothetical protein Y039_5442 [Burkholderia pseudomallei MSHR1029]|nr:hypothetical protein Y039_5442 [Burkholderia pseudomallei MSHR1029]